MTTVFLAGLLSCGDAEQRDSAEPQEAETDGPPIHVKVAQPAFPIEPAEVLATSPELEGRGAEIYGRRCMPCHGAKGAGDGPAAYLLYPKPRDFVTATYRFVSTWEGLPTDKDLFRSISRGIPGSAMPSWAHLPEKDRWALVHFVKSLASDPIEVAAGEAAAPADGEGLIAVPAEEAVSPSTIAHGNELFQATCAQCHGPLGQGDGQSATTLKDDKKVPIRPRDLTTGVFKGPRRLDDLYRRIVGGVPGTPMPQNPHLIGVDGWHVVHFVMSLSSDELRERAEMKRYRIPVPKVADLPDHPDSGAWQDLPKVELHLMPIWWRYDRPEYVTVRAAHDGAEIALLMTWADQSRDDRVIRPQDFRDGAAVQLADSTQDPPFFAMGEPGHGVNIWMWKSEREADLREFHDVESQYPQTGIDSYPNLSLAPYEQPMRDALTLKADKTFITAWGAGNIVADPTRRKATEDLAAEGFGTLRARAHEHQQVEAVGEHGHGSYRVVFRRSLEGVGDDSVSLQPGTVALVGFAIWNGSKGDRDGKKSVTIWQELQILE